MTATTAPAVEAAPAVVTAGRSMADRSVDYGALMRLLESFGNGKFNADELHTIRDTADTLLFEDPAAGQTEEHMRAAEQMLSKLTGNGRLIEETAEKIRGALLAVAA